MEEGLKLLPVTVAEVCSTAALGVSLGTGVAVCTGAGIATAAISSFYIESIRSRYYKRDFNWNSVLTNTFQSSIDVATVMAMTYAGGIFVEAAMPYTMLMLKNGVTVVGTGVYKVAKRVYVVVNGVLKSVEANLGQVGQYIDLKTGQVYDTLENIQVALNFATGDVYESGGKLVIKNDKYSIAKVVDDGFGGKALGNVSTGNVINSNTYVESIKSLLNSKVISDAEINWTEILRRHASNSTGSGDKFLDSLNLRDLYNEVSTKIIKGDILNIKENSIANIGKNYTFDIDMGRTIGFESINTGVKDINGAFIYNIDKSKAIHKVQINFSIDPTLTSGYRTFHFTPLR